MFNLNKNFTKSCNLIFSCLTISLLSSNLLNAFDCFSTKFCDSSFSAETDAKVMDPCTDNPGIAGLVVGATATAIGFAVADHTPTSLAELKFDDRACGVIIAAGVIISLCVWYKSMSERKKKVVANITTKLELVSKASKELSDDTSMLATEAYSISQDLAKTQAKIAVFQRELQATQNAVAMFLDAIGQTEIKITSELVKHDRAVQTAETTLLAQFKADDLSNIQALEQIIRAGNLSTDLTKKARDLFAQSQVLREKIDAADVIAERLEAEFRALSDILAQTESTKSKP